MKFLRTSVRELMMLMRLVKVSNPSIKNVDSANYIVRQIKEIQDHCNWSKGRLR